VHAEHSHWLHENFIPKTIGHHFWPRLMLSKKTTTTILQVLGFLDAEHILMHFFKIAKFHAGEGRKITTLCTFESFSISNNSSQEGAIPCQKRQKR
jgi:hypothetical protein